MYMYFLLLLFAIVMTGFLDETHKILINKFRDYTKNITFTKNGNVIDQCTSDCQRFIHYCTDISSKVSGSINNMERGNLSDKLSMASDVFEHDGKMCGWGELEVEESGDNQGLVWGCEYSYLWKECFQQPLGDDISGFGSELNVKAFSIIFKT